MAVRVTSFFIGIGRSMGKEIVSERPINANEPRVEADSPSRLSVLDFVEGNDFADPRAPIVGNFASQQTATTHIETQETP